MIDVISPSEMLQAADKIVRIIESMVWTILMLTAWVCLNGGLRLDRYPVSSISNADPGYRPHVQQVGTDSGRTLNSVFIL